MSPDIKSVGMTAIAVVASLLLFATMASREQSAAEKEQAQLSVAEREIRAGNQDVVEIPVAPSFAERKFAAGELIEWKIVDADLRPIPAFQRPDPFVFYDVVANGASLFRGPYGPRNGDVRFKTGDAVIIKVARPEGPKKFFLKLSRRWKPSSFGFYGGPGGQ